MKYAAVGAVALVLIGVVAWLWRGRLGEQGRASSMSFYLPVDEAFALKQPGKVVVVGVVAEGEVRPGVRLVLRSVAGDRQVTVEALEAFGQPLQVARQGDRVGLILLGASKEQVGPGAVLLSGRE